MDCLWIVESWESLQAEGKCKVEDIQKEGKVAVDLLDKSKRAVKSDR